MIDFTKYQSEINELGEKLKAIEFVINPEDLEKQIKELELQVSDPSLWDDADTAQEATSKLSRTTSELKNFESIKQEYVDLNTLLGMAKESLPDDQDLISEELDQILRKISPEIESLELKILLSGKYDSREALVTIRSGAGGVDAADWTQMVLRMYLRWAERHNYDVEVYDISYFEEAGIKSATFTVKSQFAYGILSVEMGTHRLVRISPFDHQSRRQTSFAEVEVLPVVEVADHIEIPEADIRVDVFRSSGPGGQSVNTTDSAVRLTHIPTNTVVSCQNEKSQLQNKNSAMKVLQAKLLEIKRKQEKDEMDQLRGDQGNSWGNQMRSYVLHPYQMVKDLRTEYEVGNPQIVLDGDLDGFIDAAIKARAVGKL